MSSGHHHSYRHNAACISQVRGYLVHPKIREELNRPYRTDASQAVPFTGGSSKDGRVFYLDRSLPKDYRPFVLWHERVEKALRSVAGLSYSRAHTLATCAERLLVEERGLSWETYKKAIAKIVRQNERPARMPEGFDTGPYRESGREDLLA